MQKKKMRKAKKKRNSFKERVDEVLAFKTQSQITREAKKGTPPPKVQIFNPTLHHTTTLEPPIASNTLQHLLLTPFSISPTFFWQQREKPNKRRNSKTKPECLNESASYHKIFKMLKLRKRKQDIKKESSEQMQKHEVNEMNT